LQTYVTPASVSLNVNVAAVEGLLLFGPVIPGFGGGVVSTVQVREADGPLTFPAASVASTVTVWLPSASPENVAGFAHAA
jgi:hypothetical protein